MAVDASLYEKSGFEVYQLPGIGPLSWDTDAANNAFGSIPYDHSFWAEVYASFRTRVRMPIEVVCGRTKANPTIRPNLKPKLFLNLLNEFVTGEITTDEYSRGIQKVSSLCSPEEWAWYAGIINQDAVFMFEAGTFNRYAPEEYQIPYPLLTVPAEIIKNRPEFDPERPLVVEPHTNLHSWYGLYRDGKMVRLNGGGRAINYYPTEMSKFFRTEIVTEYMYGSDTTYIRDIHKWTDFREGIEHVRLEDRTAMLRDVFWQTPLHAQPKVLLIDRYWIKAGELDQYHRLFQQQGYAGIRIRSEKQDQPDWVVLNQ